MEAFDLDFDFDFDLTHHPPKLLPPCTHPRVDIANLPRVVFHTQLTVPSITTTAIAMSEPPKKMRSLYAELLPEATISSAPVKYDAKDGGAGGKQQGQLAKKRDGTVP